MQTIRRREVAMALFAISIAVIWLNYFFGVLKDQASFLKSLVTFTVSFSIALGTITLTRSQLSRVLRRERGQWPYSIVLLVCFYTMLILGLFIPPIGGSEQYQWLYNNVFSTTQIAFGAIVPFFIASAMYRAFRVRSFESLLLVAGTCLALLRAVPFGVYLIPGLSNLVDWLMLGPVTGTSRGLMIGISIGFIAMSVRVLLGLERGFFGAEKEVAVSGE
jgi:hypothetical protein